MSCALPDFAELRPHVTVNLTTRMRPFSFLDAFSNAAIHHDRPVWPGAVTRHLMDESMLPMSSTALRANLKLRKRADLHKTTLIHQATRPRAWAQMRPTVSRKGATSSPRSGQRKRLFIFTAKETATLWS
jgi:hypothetical protein